MGRPLPGLLISGVLLGLMLLVGSLMVFKPAQAQFSNTDFRVSQLETEVGNLRSQVNRLAARVDRGTPMPQPSPPSAPNLAPDRGLIAATDPQFTRLANLVIELREAVSDLQARVRTLEIQHFPT